MVRVTDDLCDIFCKQMRRVLHSAEEALKTYLTDNQEKTDEILRRFASLEGLLKSDQPPTEVHQWALEGISLDAASMVDLEPNRTPDTVELGWTQGRLQCAGNERHRTNRRGANRELFLP